MKWYKWAEETFSKRILSERTYFHFESIGTVNAKASEHQWYKKSERRYFHFSWKVEGGTFTFHFYFSWMRESIGGFGKVKGRTFTLRMKVSWVSFSTSIIFTFRRSSFTIASWVGEMLGEVENMLFVKQTNYGLLLFIFLLLLFLRIF